MEDKTPAYYGDGIYTISNEDYHAAPAISRSALNTFHRNPYHYWHEYLNPYKEPQDPSADLILGELVHTLCLEPHLIDQKFCIVPNIDKRTKKGKEIWQEFIADVEKVPGLRLVQEDVMATAQDMAFEIKSNHLFCELSQNAVFENSIFFTHPQTKMQCKVRPDMWNNSIVADIKTTRSLSYRSFQSACIDHGYFLQAAMIADALLSQDIILEKFIIFAVEKTEPYSLGIFTIDDIALDYGKQLFNKLMLDFQEYSQRDKWKTPEIQNLLLPAYAVL